MTGSKTVLFTSQNPSLFVELQRARPNIALVAIGSTVPALESGGDIWCFVDFILPEISGLEMCRRLRADPVTQKSTITMVFDQADKEMLVRAMQAGADDYVVGLLSSDEVLRRIENGASHVMPSDAADRIELGDVVVEPQAYRVKYRGKRVNLAPNEFQLLLHFAHSPDKVFSRKDLIQLSGKPLDEIENRTVDVWIGRLRRAFKKVGAPEVIRTVRPIGYVFEIP
jgi:two-component system, OmpR family, phosphate regulon response regulator PhoB